MNEISCSANVDLFVPNSFSHISPSQNIANMSPFIMNQYTKVIQYSEVSYIYQGHVEFL